jgi:hypothetical protein
VAIPSSTNSVHHGRVEQFSCNVNEPYCHAVKRAVSKTGKNETPSSNSPPLAYEGDFK